MPRWQKHRMQTIFRFFDKSSRILSEKRDSSDVPDPTFRIVALPSWHAKLSALRWGLGALLPGWHCCPRPAGRIGQALTFLAFEPPEPSHCSERRENPRETLPREISRGTDPKGLIGRYRPGVSERENESAAM